MSNEQLFLAIGIPIAFNGIFFMVTAIYVNGRFTSIENRIDHLEKKLDSLFEPKLK